MYHITRNSNECKTNKLKLSYLSYPWRDALRK